MQTAEAVVNYNTSCSQHTLVKLSYGTILQPVEDGI